MCLVGLLVHWPCDRGPKARTYTHTHSLPPSDFVTGLIAPYRNSANQLDAALPPPAPAKPLAWLPVVPANEMVMAASRSSGVGLRVSEILLGLKSQTCRQTIKERSDILVSLPAYRNLALSGEHSYMRLVSIVRSPRRRRLHLFIPGLGALALTAHRASNQRASRFVDHGPPPEGACAMCFSCALSDPRLMLTVSIESRWVAVTSGRHEYASLAQRCPSLSQW